MKKLVFEVRFHPIRKDLRLAPHESVSYPWIAWRKC